MQSLTEVALHAAAPDKPPYGAPCNGCGVCCVLAPCPVGRVRFLKNRGPCLALRWDAATARYQCGLVSQPGEYLRWLPSALQTVWKRIVTRWIAAGSGCDCDAIVD